MLTVLLAAILVWALLSLNYVWKWKTIWSAANAEHMLGGLLWTLIVSLGAMVVGLAVGIAAGLGRMSRRIVPNHYATLYVELIRGTPLLVQIYIAWFCIATVTQLESKALVGILTLGIFAGAYVAEIVRAGFEAVPWGQMEAARSVGMKHRQAMVHVIAPQALKNALPPLAGQFISLIKDSSLLMFIGVMEVTKRADELNSATYSSFEIFLPLAGLYLLLTLPLSQFTQWLERRMGGGRREHRL